MVYEMKALPCEPSKLKGLSEKLIVSHYENNYGGAVKRLNAITAQLDALDFGAKAAAYVDAFMQNIDWQKVAALFTHAAK
jgi:superoxide dismutase